MLLTEIIRVAFASLRANKLRSLLTMLGIVIGVGAVIVMVAVGNGAQTQILAGLTSGDTVVVAGPANLKDGEAVAIKR